jgi:hypothetical protein
LRQWIKSGNWRENKRRKVKDEKRNKKGQEERKEGLVYYHAKGIKQVKGKRKKLK